VVRARRRAVSRTGSLRKATPSALRRVVLAMVLVVMVLVPLPVLASDTSPRPSSCADSGCHVLWQTRLVGTWPAGTWSAGTGLGTTGDGSTVPGGGQPAYVAVGGGLVVVGTGLSLTGYDADTGHVRWQTTLTAPFGTQIVSVRAWSGAITVGLLALGGQSRTEAVIAPSTGLERQHYPAAVLGGAVFASATTTVVIGRAAVTSYNNANGRVRWQHTTGSAQSWQVDGPNLYVTDSTSPSDVTALRVIDLETGAERMLRSPPGQPFSGTLAMAVDGAVVFASTSGVTAYDGLTGDELWAMPGWVPEGTDPETQRAEFTAANGTLLSVDPMTVTDADPLTATVAASVPASVVPRAAGLYVVRDGVALGLNSGANGAAWGYDTAKGAVTWTSPSLPWPHFFSDAAGLGGSAAADGSMVVVTDCPRLSTTDPGSCADPRLVALNV
jgi:hypothetical protein